MCRLISLILLVFIAFKYKDVRSYLMERFNISQKNADIILIVSIVLLIIF